MRKILVGFLSSAFLFFSGSCVKQEAGRKGLYYEIPLEVSSADHFFRDKTAELEIDLAGLLKDRFHIHTNIEDGSVRVAEFDHKGNYIHDCACQYDVNNTLIWLMEGDFLPKTRRFFRISFNTAGQAAKMSPANHLVIKKGKRDSLEFTTPSLCAVYGMKEGGFHVFSPFSCEDNREKSDWIRDDQTPDQSIMYIADPDGKIVFGPHPQTFADTGSWNGCKSDIIFGGAVRYRIRSTKRYGRMPGDLRSGAVFSVIYDIFPDFIRARIVKSGEPGFQCMINLTPGGDILDSSDYLIASDGKEYLRPGSLQTGNGFPWLYSGDAGDSTSLFFVRSGESPADLKMVRSVSAKTLKAGWLIQPSEGSNMLHDEYFFGFVHTENFSEAKRKIKSILSVPEIAVGTIERKGSGKMCEDTSGRDNLKSWFRIDTLNRTISNSLISVGFGGDRIPAANNRVSGITEFVYKPFNENLAFALDAYGYDYARYFHGGPSMYEVTAKKDEYIEVSIASVIENQLRVRKKERIFNDLPVLEIEYTELQLVWLQDFYHGKNEKNRLYTICNIPDSIDFKKQETLRKIAEETCGHNFGDCFISATGSTPEKVLYKGCLIFGFYDKDTQVGLGFVLPERIGLRDGFKLWNMHSYESFPFHRKEKVLPYKRWIFATADGREGIWKMGKAIADVQDRNESLSSNPDYLKQQISGL
jgi:hypothetical protein